MQVDPVKPKLKLPGTKRLKLNCGEPLSKMAFKFNLRRYIMMGKAREAVAQTKTLLASQAGAYTRSLLSST